MADDICHQNKGNVLATALCKSLGEEGNYTRHLEDTQVLHIRKE